MKAFIFTAGKGSRLAPLTQILPKPALPLMNKPLVEYSLQLYRDAGIKEFAFNLHHLPAQMRATLVQCKRAQESFTFFDESNKILGSSGALPQAASWWGEDEYLFIGNGDECFLPNQPNIMAELYRAAESSKCIATLLVKEHLGVGSEFGGIWTDSDLKVIDIGKPQNPTGRGYHYTGYAIIHRSILKYLKINEEQNIFYDTLLPLIHSNQEQVRAHVSEGFWSETGNPKGFLKTTNDLFELFDQFDPRVEFIKTSGFKMYSGKNFKVFAAHDKPLPANEYIGKNVIHPNLIWNSKTSYKIEDSILMQNSLYKSHYINEICLEGISAS